MEKEKEKAIDIFDIKRFFRWFNKNDIATLEKIAKDIAKDIVNENDDFGGDIYEEILRRFKAQKYYELGVRELILHTLTVLSYNDRTRIQLYPKPIQDEIINAVESKRSFSLDKYRVVDGVTTILAAIFAVKAYLLRGKHYVFVSPNAQMGNLIAEKIRDFIDQIHDSLNVVGNGRIYKINSRNVLRLYNGTVIRFLSSSNGTAQLRGLSNIDYAIVDEASFIKDPNINQELNLIKESCGVIIRTYSVEPKIYFEKENKSVIFSTK